jgi:micrococcal nuclease
VVVPFRGRERAAWLAAAVVLGAACAGTGGDAGDPEPPVRETATSEAAGEGDGVVVVGSITDGDTFRTTTGERVRLIGIDSPEVVDDACFADQATAAIADLIPPGTEVRLVLDVDAQDRYGRTLAYVERAADGLDVNEELARQGFAVQLTVPPNVARVEALGDAVAEARAAGRGLWGACAATTTRAPSTTTPPATVPPPPPPPPTTVPPAVQPVVPTVPPVVTGNCHPSYPDVCIPPAPPDLDCPQISHRRFTVVGEDPHGFDGDRDGIGCEA